MNREQVDLVVKLEGAISRHTRYLKVVGERLCDYYSQLALVVEESQREQKSIDQTSGEKRDGLLARNLADV